MNLSCLGLTMVNDLSSNQMPADYPADLYWQGDKRQLDYNYLLVRVNGDEVQMTLKRFRPNEMQPLQEVDMVPGRME